MKLKQPTITETLPFSTVPDLRINLKGQKKKKKYVFSDKNEDNNRVLEEEINNGTSRSNPPVIKSN